MNTRIIKFILHNFKQKSFDKPGGYFHIWQIAYPLIIMSASHTVMQFCDRKFLSMNSTMDVTAALPAGILFFTLFSFFMVTTNFTSAIVSQFYGKGDKASCVKAVWSGFYFAVCVSVIIGYVLPHLGEYLISINGHAPEILEREKDYFLTLMPGGAFICISASFCAFFSGRGKTWVVTVIHVFGCLLNIGLDYIFIFGKLGLPPMGILGAGIATTLASVATSFISLSCFLLYDQSKFKTRNFEKPSFEHIKRLLAFGTPAGLQVLFDVGAFTLVTFLIGYLSDTALAATTIALSISMLSFMPLLGLADATSILVGQFIGKKKKQLAELVAYRSWLVASAYMCITGTIYILFPEELMNFFAPKDGTPAEFKAVVEVGTAVLACVAVFNFFDATKFIFNGALRGGGDTKASMIISTCCAWGIQVPGVILLVCYFKASIISIWVLLTFNLLVEGTLIFFRFRRGLWKHIGMTEAPPAEAEEAVELAAVPIEAKGDVQH